MPATESTRTGAYGETREPTIVDRLGGRLSERAIMRRTNFDGARIADFGCGYEASLALKVAGRAESALLVDLKLSPALARIPNVNPVEGRVEDVLGTLDSNSLDVILCVSVLEHLWSPQHVLSEFSRLLVPGGKALINVPTWRGKRFLEFAAFRLGVSPDEEMDDHKRYYEPRQLWPMLVAAGFPPSHIRCRRHKFGLNTFAACTAPGP